MCPKLIKMDNFFRITWIYLRNVGSTWLSILKYLFLNNRIYIFECTIQNIEVIANFSLLSINIPIKFGLNVSKLLGHILLIEIMKTRIRRQNFIKEKRQEKSHTIVRYAYVLNNEYWCIIIQLMKCIIGYNEKYQ